jgi:hypothetical protein
MIGQVRVAVSVVTVVGVPLKGHDAVGAGVEALKRTVLRRTDNGRYEGILTTTLRSINSIERFVKSH